MSGRVCRAGQEGEANLSSGWWWLDCSVHECGFAALNGGSKGVFGLHIGSSSLARVRFVTTEEAGRRRAQTPQIGCHLLVQQSRSHTQLGACGPRGSDTWICAPRPIVRSR